MNIVEFVECLRCPVTGSALKPVDLEYGHGTRLVPVPRKGRDIKPLVGGATDRALMPDDESFAYPIVDGIPVLLAPERLLPACQAAGHPVIDLLDPMYAEAYEEMAFYNSPYVSPLSYRNMGGLVGYEDIASIAPGFPEPARIWLDTPHESLAQLEAYRHLAPVAGKTVLQIGGRGSHAVKMLLAGAGRGFLITPMVTEARHAERLATDFGVRDRFAPVLGIGEQIPFAANVIDLVFSGGCFHHMRWEYLGAELYRVLSKGGKFAGTDPYKTLLHTIGTKLLGKREPSVYCRPVTPERVMELKKWFPDMTANQHGPLLRYLFLGLEKLSMGYFTLSLATMMKVMRTDNFLGRLAHLEGHGGAVVIAGTKSTH